MYMCSANVVVKNVTKKDGKGGEGGLMEVVAVVMMTAESLLKGKLKVSILISDSSYVAMGYL